MKPYILSLLLSVCTSTMANDLESLSDTMTHFYTSPSQTAFNSFQESAQTLSDTLQSDKLKKLEPLITVMIARIAEKHNWSIQDGYFADNARNILKEGSKSANYIQNDQIVNPQKLDIWWTSFFATGEEQYLEKILVYAGEEMPKDELKQAMLIGAATWSFNSNCEQHPAVKAFIDKKVRAYLVSDRKIKNLGGCV